MPKKGPPRHVQVSQSSFTGNIYLRRHELKNLHTLHDSAAWPQEVYILSNEDKLTHDVWVDAKTGKPCSVYAWVEKSFKEQVNAPLDQLHHALRIWWGVHERITTYLIIHRKQNVSNLHALIFNLTWTMLGYTEGQEKYTLDTVFHMFMDPRFDSLTLSLDKDKSNGKEAKVRRKEEPKKRRSSEANHLRVTGRPRVNGTNKGLSFTGRILRNN